MLTFDLHGAVVSEGGALCARCGSLARSERETLFGEGLQAAGEQNERLNLNIDLFHAGFPVDAQAKGLEVSIASVVEGDGDNPRAGLSDLREGHNPPALVGRLDIFHFQSPVLSNSRTVEATGGGVNPPPRASAGVPALTVSADD